jgi:hypothetical protein
MVVFFGLATYDSDIMGCSCWFFGASCFGRNALVYDDEKSRLRFPLFPRSKTNMYRKWMRSLREDRGTRSDFGKRT